MKKIILLLAVLMYSFNTQASNQTFEEERVVHVCVANHTLKCEKRVEGTGTTILSCITLPCQITSIETNDEGYNDLASSSNTIINSSYNTELSQLDLLLGVSKVTVVKTYAGGSVYCSLSGGDYVWRDNNGHFYYMQRVTNTAGTVYLPTDLGSGIEGSSAAARRCAGIQ